MNFTQELNKRQFYKFSGPPENWITAIKYMTWGLEQKYEKQWQGILPGDLFLMHSMSTNTLLKNVKPSIIGFGIVAAQHKRNKTEYLWIKEKSERVNQWPLLVPFSEIYLFTDFNSRDLPDVQINNLAKIQALADSLLASSVPLAMVSGFPQMGSISPIRRPEVVDQIFSLANSLYPVSSETIISDEIDYFDTPLLEYEQKKDVFRYSTSLNTLESVKKKIFAKEKKGNYSVDPILKERADDEHQETLEKLRHYFINHGYETFFNRHIDLFATNDKKSYLMEVKSLNQKNFLPQSRKGIVQLFEYEYFEIKNFLKKEKSSVPVFKNLTFSQEPKDTNYIGFMNSLDLGATYFTNEELKFSGRSDLVP